MNMNKFSEYALVVISIIILSIPTISMVLHIGPSATLTEKRNLAKFPDIKFDHKTISELPTGLKNYYSDNYGFRSYLIKTYCSIMTNYIKSTRREKVLFGKDNWLFWTGENVLDQYAAIKPVSLQELQKYKQIHEERNSYCTKRGIKYLLIVVPNKHTIYSEYLPDWLTKHSKESHFDQIFSYFKKNSEIQFVDMRDALLLGKSKNQLYHPNDTHWNDIGAFIGYELIMKKITNWFPSVESYKFSDFKIESVLRSGDLARMVGLEDQYNIKAPIITLKKAPQSKLKRLDQFYLDNYPEKIINKENPINEIGIFIMENNKKNLPKAVIFRDSFFQPLVPYFSEHFRRVVYYWYLTDRDTYDFHSKIIEYEKPDIVIYEVAERNFPQLKDNPEEVKKEYFKK